jgi:hypothetical protein
MYFSLVLTVDRKPNLGTRAANLARAAYTGRTDPEARFWNDLGRAPKSDRAESPAPLDVNAANVKMREEFAKELRIAVACELRNYYLTKDTTAAQSTEITKAIDGIRFNIGSIRGGSLEVLLFVLGFAKLVQAIGITPEEFAKYVDIAAPTAMSLIFGVAGGAIAADTTPVGDERPVGGESGGAPATRPRPEPSMASLYFMPALFSAVAFGAAMYAFVQISSRMMDERAAYGGYLRDEMKDISNERREIADKLATLIAQHDSALAAAQKTLFDDQMTLLKSASDANAARDNAVVDLVKARLISTPPETKPLPVPCALDGTQVRNVQAVLVEYLLYRGQPDGLWGPHTENGVGRFQSRLNLPITGYIDPVTAARLGIPCKSP